MSENPWERALEDEVRREKLELKSSLAHVRRLFHEHRTARPNGAARLLDSLDELRERLGMMFALQETHGYLDDVITTRPPLGVHVGELRAEHERLFEGISRMIEQCDRDVARGRWEESWKLAEMTFENFCERLRNHEAGEAELAQQAFHGNAGAAG